MNKLLVKSSILSISLLTVMASAAISPALAKIFQAFPGVDPTLIKLVLTLPSLLIIPFSLLCGWLVKRMPKKYILLVGLVIYFAAGVGGAFAQTVTQLLIIRAIFGMGVGLIIPLSTSLIADFYEGIERTKVMGYSGSVSHLGGVIFLLVSGWLACISWRLAFAVYGLSLLILLMILLWLPEPQVTKSAGLVKSKLPLAVYICAVWGALMMIAFYAAPTNLAMFIDLEKIGRPGIAGYLLSAMTIVGVVSGIFLSQLMRRVGVYCASVAILSMAVGYGLLGVTASLTGVIISMLCIGFSSGVLMPLLLLEVAKNAPNTARAFAMAVVSVGVYLGQFLSPVALKIVSNLFGKGNVFRQQFNFLSFGLGVATVVALAMAIKNRKSWVAADIQLPHH
jgi:MFS family permease